MKRTLLRSAGIFLCLLGFIAAKAQVSVSATAGTASGTYTTLGNAFTAINNGTHQGVISITLTGNTLETSSASLDSSGNPTASSYTSISIQPAAGTPVTITGAVAGPLINLNGADNVTIDGIALAPGGATLTITNTSTANSASTIHFVNDASSNIIKNTTIRGATSGSGISTGVVVLNTGLATGNDNNTFLNNDIDGTGFAGVGILSKGVDGPTFSTFQYNSGNTVTNCWLHDQFNAALGTAIGIHLFTGNTNWVFSGNSFYQTIPRTTTSNISVRGISILQTSNTDNHIITGNYFGGSGPGASNSNGNMELTGTGGSNIGLLAFDIEVVGVGTLVENNIVRNVKINSTTSFTNAAFFGLSFGFNGEATFNNNQVRDLTFINDGVSGTSNFHAYYMQSYVTTGNNSIAPIFNVTNNIANNITATSTVSANFPFYGIRLEAVNPNNFTFPTTINNPVFNVVNNQISAITITSLGTNTFLKGIAVNSRNGTSSTSPLMPKASILNNSVYNLSCTSQITGYSNPSTVGVSISGSINIDNTTDIHTISGNTIYNLSAPVITDISNAVIGIRATNGIYNIERNRVYGLSNGSIGLTNVPVVAGVNILEVFGMSSIKNNFVSLGAGESTNTNFFGILSNFNSTNPINVYFNSVYLTGIAGSRNSVPFYRGNEAMTSAITTPVDLKNNIFYNFRSGGTGKNYAIGSFGTGTWTSNYNVLFSVDPATTATWNNADNDLATYKTNSGQEANSLRTTVNFVDPANGDLHLAGASVGDVNLRGVPVTGITTDFDNQNRSSSNPYIGADEASISLPVQVANFSGVKENGRNRLSWTTSIESNNKGFELERSADGKNFSSIGFIVTKADKGNSTTALSYAFTDERPIAGTNYYRLRQVDNDGRSSYSGIVILKDEKAFSISALYPNPAKDVMKVSINTEKAGRATYSIIDIAGKVLQQNTINLINGDNNVSLNISSLATGIYHIRIVNESGEIRIAQFAKH